MQNLEGKKWKERKQCEICGIHLKTELCAHRAGPTLNRWLQAAARVRSRGDSRELWDRVTPGHLAARVGKVVDESAVGSQLWVAGTPVIRWGCEGE